MAVTQPYKPAHEMRVTLTKGKERVTCICGWQAPTFDKGDEAGVLLYRKHAGLVEKK